MEIEGLGSRLEQLVEAGLVTDEASLWDLEVDDLAELPGWGELSAAKLLGELEEARSETASPAALRARYTARR